MDRLKHNKTSRIKLWPLLVVIVGTIFLLNVWMSGENRSPPTYHIVDNHVSSTGPIKPRLAWKSSLVLEVVCDRQIIKLNVTQSFEELEQHTFPVTTQRELTGVLEYHCSTHRRRDYMLFRAVNDECPAQHDKLNYEDVCLHCLPRKGVERHGAFCPWGLYPFSSINTTTSRRTMAAITSIWQRGQQSPPDLIYSQHSLEQLFGTGLVKHDYLQKAQAYMVHQRKLDPEAKPPFPINFTLTDSSRLRKLLPQTSKAVRPKMYKTCSIVGSSGALLGSGYGRQIDNADAVFRVNIPQIAPQYEFDTGKRVDYYIIGAGHYRTMQMRYHYDQIVNSTLLYSGITSDGPDIEPNFIDIREQFPELDVYLLNMGLYEELFDVLVATNRTARASSGNFAVFLTALMCEQVDVYGFFCWDSYKPKICYHYYPDEFTYVHTFKGDPGGPGKQRPKRRYTGSCDHDMMIFRSLHEIIGDKWNVFL